jgi:glycosyltransferase involved in cell wall biosynthesis
MLTVILLTYNQRETISKAFDSILAQVVDFDYKIHVLDDCSTDGTTDICRHYQEKYPEKIQLFVNKTNLGVCQNFKQGILRIKTKYFGFLEGDDYWCGELKLQRQIEVIEQNPDIMICGHNTLFKDFVRDKEYLLNEKTEKTRYTISDNFGVHPSSRIYRNSLNLEDLPPHMVLDTHIFLVYMTHGDLYYIDEVWSVYNLTGKGFWSGKRRGEKKRLMLKYQYNTNKYFNFVYDYRFFQRSVFLKILKRLLGVSCGWRVYYYLMIPCFRIRYLFR